MKALALLVALLVVTAGCGGSSHDTAEQSTPFAYDASAPLHYADHGVVNHGYPIVVHDVSFTSSGERVDAMLVVPPGKGPFPAVVYLHGTGGDRTELLVPATWMAARGVVAMTITMPERLGADDRHGDAEAGRSAQGGRRHGHRSEARSRRAAVAAAGRRRPDRARRLELGGAGRRDRRGRGRPGQGVRSPLGRLAAHRGVRLAGTGGAPARDRAGARRRRPPALGQAGASGTILLQNGTNDEVVPRAALDALAAAAGKAAEVRWYDQGHAPSNAAWADQLDWTADRLGVAGPIVKGAATGP